MMKRPKLVILSLILGLLVLYGIIVKVFLWEGIYGKSGIELNSTLKLIVSENENSVDRILEVQLKKLVRTNDFYHVFGEIQYSKELEGSVFLQIYCIGLQIDEPINLKNTGATIKDNIFSPVLGLDQVYSLEQHDHWKIIYWVFEQNDHSPEFFAQIVESSSTLFEKDSGEVPCNIFTKEKVSLLP